MEFIEPKLDVILLRLKTITDEDKPLWGTMSAQRMIEHLSDTLELSLGNHDFELEIPEDKISKAHGFLKSEHPLPKNFTVAFATPDTPVRHNSIEEAINEFEQSWNNFTSFFNTNPETKTLHPNFGELSYELWLRLHSKHISHHLEQFNR